MATMKKQLHLIIYILAVCLAGTAAQHAAAQTWNFQTVSQADQDLLAADTEAWTHEQTSSNNRYKNKNKYSAQPLTAGGQELEFAKGLLFTATAEDAIRVDVKGKRMATNKVTTITIKNLKAGHRLAMRCKSSKSGTARGVNVTNLKPEQGFFNQTSADEQNNTATVEADGDVTLTNTGGMYVYELSVTDPNEGGGGTGGEDKPANDHSVAMNTAVNQARLKTTDNQVKYYNTEDIAAIEFDNGAGTVTVKPVIEGWEDVYTNSIQHIDFAKAATQPGGGDITIGEVKITEAKGWYESVYAKWEPLDGAEGYNVYVKGGQLSEYTKIDPQLVRNYGTYMRADIPGLAPADDYSIMVAPVAGGTEQAAKASTAGNLNVAAYSRAGFAHLGYSGIGAYNADGTLKDGARVIYVTPLTAKTVQLSVKVDDKGKEQTFTGLQAIINAFQKGKETRPLAIRLIGTIRGEQMDSFGSSAEGLQIKGRNNSTPMNITIEGIGEDAGIWGFGMLVRNALSVELRNFAVMLCMDDCISLDTDNKHCWIHHLDLFYGNTGGDADQAKGDGTIDVKGDSQYITIAYCHFFDSGKSSLCGMKSETGPNYIDYNNNWFDHSDSRHPRVRTMTVHVWNNYYDGCSKYGVGATTGASVFVENNYFRATKNPMLISLQGTDAKGDGTFSGENGGVIKSFGNVYAEKGTSANYTPITHRQNATSFDCYEATERAEEVPATVKALVGGTAYNNFDTDPALIYTYTPADATEVPAHVTGYWGAGRLNKGDFKWTFTNSTEDTSYGVNQELKTALLNYKGGLVE